MLAIKYNKQYKINEVSKGKYLADGYDIADDEGNIIERSHSSKVPYDEYIKVKNELEALKAAVEHVDDNPEEQPTKPAKKSSK